MMDFDKLEEYLARSSLLDNIKIISWVLVVIILLVGYIVSYPIWWILRYIRRDYALESKKG